MDLPPTDLPPPPAADIFPISTTETETATASAPSHPPYPEMIFGAVAALKEEGGSSKQAISRYIEQAYHDLLPPAHPALLTHHLQQLRNSGHLIIVKKSYMLPHASAAAQLDVTAINSNNIESIESTLVVSGGETVVRKRGRPPKVAENGSGKRRGRPPKVKTVEEVPLNIVPIQPEEAVKEAEGVHGGVTESVGVVKRGRGRPRKLETVVGVVDGGGGGGGGGESGGMEIVVPQVQQEVVGLVKRRGRPKRINNVSGIAAVSTLPVMKKRGRPKLVKRRGRPPKYGAAVGVLGAGRRRGRPRKNAPMVRSLPSAQAEEQTRKLEFMQACIKSAVTMLKPHVNPNSTEAATALLRLEELITWNIKPVAEPTVPAVPLATASGPPPFNNPLPSMDLGSQQSVFDSAM
ncbi:HMG-Y-related protein [Drosera capensis]